MPLETKTILACRKVSHSYGNHQVLHDIDFALQEGHIYGFLGPNGCGKTTLFRLLNTSISLLHGEIFMNDVKLSDKTMKDQRRQIGVVFQDPSLDKKLTVFENLYFHGKLYGLNKADLILKTDELFHKFHLAPYRNTLVETLSGGWARRVEIAKALLHDPSLILMDEPSSGLDPKARIELWNILSTLKDEGKTIVLTTHHLDEADHCDELIVMYEGKIVAKGTPNLLKHRLKMKVVFLKSSQSTEIETFLTKEKDVKISRHRHLLRIEMPENSQLITTLMESYKGKIDELSYRSPNLEDVFIHFTGSEFEVGASL